MVLTILGSVLLFHFTAAVASEPQYVLWISSVMQSHSVEKACVHLLNLNESVSLSVVLECDGVNTTIFDQSVEENNFYACASFKVSEKSSEQLAFVTLLAKGNTLHLFERRSVAITSEETVTFVQTDKPLYKPAEKGESIFMTRDSQNCQRLATGLCTTIGERIKLYVHIRVVTLDIKFKPVAEEYPLITLQNPQRNRIFQWQNVTSFQNITQLLFQLISEPMLGKYLITVEKKSGKTVTHPFTVEKYVLPKFEVKVNAPKTLTISDNEFQVAVCAKYTYGPPVPGKVQIQVCRQFYSRGNCDENDNKICEQFIAQLINGCASQMVNTKVFQLYQYGFFMSFYIKAAVTEFGTGVQINEKTSISITQLLGTVSFENTDLYYRRGITFSGTLKFSDPNNVPMVSKLLQLELNEKFIGNYTTDENGEAQFSMDTSDMFEPQYRLRATYIRPSKCYGSNWLTPDYGDAYWSVSRFYSRTDSFLKIIPEPKPLKCNQQKTVNVHYSLNSKAYPDNSNIKFFYLVMVRGTILFSGQKEIRNNSMYKTFTLQLVLLKCAQSSRKLVSSYQLMAFLIYTVWNGKFSFPVNINADLAPVAIVFVYTLHPSGEIVADSVKFQVDKCFKNKVSINLSTEQGTPGSSVHLYLRAAPDSLCALRAVDKSVLLLNSEEQLSAESVYNLLPYVELSGYFYHGLNLQDAQLDPCIPEKDMFYNGLYYKPVSSYGDGDIYNILWGMGLKVFTNLHHRKPEICPTESKQPFPEQPIGLLGFARMPSGSSKLACGGDNVDSGYAEDLVIETVRKNFPETWIWDLVSVNSSGSANISNRIPDTITKWETNGFCVNGDVGFGISSAVNLRTFQNFFVDITLPISMIQKEQFDVIASVFNYQNTCAEVSVQLEGSENYETRSNALPSNGSEIIHPGEKKAYVWTIIPKTLGKVTITAVAESKQSHACPNQATKQQNVRWKDTVVKSLLVEPEGIEKEITRSFLICTKGTKTTRRIVLNLPNNAVKGSAKAFFTVVGDILGHAMQNLENLLHVPSGYGEQNIAVLASDTYVLDYLNSTQQLTEDVKSKAVSFLSSGYQKQLSFRNFDGSYSVFWQKDRQGNIWLTALTFKTLERIKKYAYIDEQVQKQTLIWLSSKQDRNGCFKSDGKSFNNAWEGGDDADVSLTAYVVGALLEAGLDATFPVLRNGLFCLEEALKSGVTNEYTRAILAYAFALAGKKEQVESLLQILDQSATKKDNMIHWETAKKTKHSPFFLPLTPSPGNEKTCYVLLAVISQKTPDLTYASKILQCLVQKMNPYGGFSSTQDTAVCLFALTQYMKLTFSNDQKNTVTFRSKDANKIFQVNKANHLVVQRSELKKATGQYTIAVEGQGCAFIQATLKYNVPVPTNAFGFSLAVEMAKKHSSSQFQAIYNLTVTFNYTGIRNNSNMVIVDIKMLSGFTPVLPTLEELESSGQVTKAEVQNGHALLYMDNVLGTAKIFTFSVEQSNRVSRIQPASAMVYDYNEKDEYALISYNIPSTSISQ
ncbi:ovostatin homolog 2-like [Echinops telfairi]|uniref:Ovostatin homolog 2-like n=1 Tax=Echinops telfairi TaxID=9371 RepID=A0AC55D3Y4_ECHTE|nr:ovostatin homolog 2-like [Echinops telfairi]